MSATHVHGWQEGGNAGWGIRVAARERGSPCAIVHEYAFIIEVDKPERNTLSRNYDNFLTYEQDIHILYAAAAGVYYITMLEQLFGSRTRIKLLKIFLAHPHQPFFVRELTRKIGERINSVRREIANLERLGVVRQGRTEEEAPVKRGKGKKAVVKGGDHRKYFRANPEFVLFEELKTLVLKSQLLVGRTLTEAVEKLGKVKLLMLTGFFVGDDEAATDLVAVGTLHRKRLAALVRLLEKSFGQEVRYTLMSTREFLSRRAMTDKFLYRILEGKKTVLVDRIDQ